MALSVIGILLVAAALHAGWNGLVNAINLKPVEKTTLINIAAGLLGAPLLLYFGPPAEPAYPYLLASTVLNNLYLFSLMYAYRAGPMDQVYPLVRGTAVFFTAIIGTAFFGERLDYVAWIGVVTMAVGIILLSLPAYASARSNPRAVRLAFLTAFFLAVGLVVDGTGARVSSNVYGYLGWMFVLMGAGTLTVALLLRGPGLVQQIAGQWKGGVASGFMMFLVYGIGVWAMTIEIIPKVAAVRDTSVLFGTATAYVLLKEPVHRIRVVATVIIVAALVLIRVG